MIRKENRTDCMGRLMEPGQLIAMGESYGSGIRIGVLHSFTPCGIRWIEFTGTHYNPGENQETLYAERINLSRNNTDPGGDPYYLERSYSLDRWESKNKWYSMRARILVLPEEALSLINKKAYKNVLQKFNLRKPKPQTV